MCASGDLGTSANLQIILGLGSATSEKMIRSPPFCCFSRNLVFDHHKQSSLSLRYPRHSFAFVFGSIVLGEQFGNQSRFTANGKLWTPQCIKTNHPRDSITHLFPLESLVA